MSIHSGRVHAYPYFTLYIVSKRDQTNDIHLGGLGGKSKDIAVRSLTGHTATGTHMPYKITQCYQPPDTGDTPAFNPAEAGTQLSDPGGVQD